MDCNHARFLLHFVRPGRVDLDAQDHKALQEHLLACSECGSQARAEAEADQAIAQAMAAVEAPPDLRERVLDRIAPVRRRWVTVVATAAAILLLAGLTWFLWPEPLPRINWDGYVPVSVAGPRDIESWFADEGVDMTAPRHLNYNFLSSFGTVLFQGRHVPRLLFARGGPAGRADIAEVFVVSDKQFDLENLPTGGPSGWSMKIEYPDRPGFAFLILYSGDSLDSFRRAEVAQE